MLAPLLMRGCVRPDPPLSGVPWHRHEPYAVQERRGGGSGGASAAFLDRDSGWGFSQAPRQSVALPFGKWKHDLFEKVASEQQQPPPREEGAEGSAQGDAGDAPEEGEMQAG